MIPNSYRIFKLRSGEQIVCEIKSSDPKAFKVKSVRCRLEVLCNSTQRVDRESLLYYEIG